MELPLFPLPNLVVFPGVLQPLHIFEERYKLMVNHCIDRDLAFGMVLLRGDSESDETIARVGTAVRVVHADRLEDGRMNILCRAESRFRVVGFLGSRPYWQSATEPFEEIESASPASASAKAASRLFLRALELSRELSGESGDPPAIPEDPTALSFAIAHALDIEADEKQELLELTSTPHRLDRLVNHLESAVERLDKQSQRQRVTHKVRGNGDLGKPHGL